MWPKGVRRRGYKPLPQLTYGEVSASEAMALAAVRLRLIKKRIKKVTRGFYSLSCGT